MTRRIAAFAAGLLLLAGTPLAAQTISEIQAKASAGDAAAQYVLGEAYRTGQGVAPDREQAIGWFRKAAAQGDVRAGDALGLLLFTKGERREAIPLLQAAAGRDDARALYLLGTAHFNGDGVPKDLPRAYAEMRRAADAGLPQAVRSLQLMEPYITLQDRTAAVAIPPGPPAPAVATAPVATPAGTIATPSPSVEASPTASAYPTRPAPTPLRTIELPPSVPATPSPSPVAAPAAAPITTAQKASAPEPAAAGRWRVQLGALVSQEKAEEHWRFLLRKVPSLAGVTHVTVQAGVFWRLQATGLADKATARALCRDVAAKGGPCIVLAP